MDQLPAFYDDQFHALRSAVEGGQGYKKTAMHLWPSMKAESAYARLKNCVSGTSEQKLDLGEVLALCQFNGRFDPLYWLCDETMHVRPVQRAASDVAKSIVAQLDETMVNATRLMTRLEALRETHPSVLEKAGR
jgi:hypothetical protein